MKSFSKNRSQSEERPPQHRAENPGGQAAVTAQCTSPWAYSGDRDRRLGGQGRLPRVRGRGDRGLRRADRGRVRAGAAACLAAPAAATDHFDRDRPAQDPVGHRPRPARRVSRTARRTRGRIPFEYTIATFCLPSAAGGAFDPLGRYNAALWKQTAQTLFLLHAIRLPLL
jgi:hypothetical protein